MTSTNFIYFLQGFLELSDQKTISADQLKMIKGHLRLAFRDDIDPSMGDKKHQQKLNNAHNGDPINTASGNMNLQEFLTDNPHLNPHGNHGYGINEPLERC